MKQLLIKLRIILQSNYFIAVILLFTIIFCFIKINSPIKSYYNSGELRPPVYFYRDKEINLIIEQNGKLYPIEIKKTANPSKDMIENFKVLETVKEVGEGAIICMYDKIINLDEKNKVIPYKYL